VGGASPTLKADAMSPMTESLTNTLLSAPTTVRLRPRYEGNNICTWIGFKHVNYLVEEAVLAHFRAAGLSSRRLFEEFGLGLDVVELNTHIRTAFHLDDVGIARVEPAGTGGLSFAVTIDRDGHGPGKAVAAKARVVLRRETYVDPTDSVPVELAPFAVDVIGDRAGVDAAALGEGDPVLEQLLAGRNGFGWRQRIPYPHCHFNERLQMSGYLRQMEATVDLFLADRGLSIRRMLDQRRWIPVVPHSKIRMLAEALMEEELYTVYVVDEVFKDLTYRSIMDTYVVRDGRLIQTSTGTITHGYAKVQSRRDWTLVNMDEPVLDAIRGVRPAR
jgi:acyl-CoA thioesterase FadM